jgi:hypothetical protein
MNPAFAKPKIALNTKLRAITTTREERWLTEATRKNVAVKTNVFLTDKDLNWGEESVWDTCGSKDPGHWFIIESTDNRETEAKIEGSAQSFNLRVDELGGTYGFSMKFPTRRAHTNANST